MELILLIFRKSREEATLSFALEKTTQPLITIDKTNKKL